MSDFSEVVKAVVRKIPKGKVMTYKEVAIATGNEKAARAVANIMAANYDPTVPCHRVIRSDGSLGGYNRGGIEVKRSILIKEGYNETAHDFRSNSSTKRTSRSKAKS